MTDQRYKRIHFSVGRVPTVRTAGGSSTIRVGGMVPSRVGIVPSRHRCGGGWDGAMQGREGSCGNAKELHCPLNALASAFF